MESLAPLTWQFSGKSPFIFFQVKDDPFEVEEAPSPGSEHRISKLSPDVKKFLLARISKGPEISEMREEDIFSIYFFRRHGNWTECASCASC